MSKKNAARARYTNAQNTGDGSAAVLDGNSNGEVVVYQPTDAAKINVRMDGETVWLTQKQMAVLFGCSSDNVGLHLKNIFKDGELDKKSSTEDFSVVDIEPTKGGSTRTVARTVRCYNLDAIISVGYRVNSKRGVAFRQWATKTLKERLLRGYVPRSAAALPPVLPYERTDAGAVRDALESNLRRVLGRDDLCGVAAFVESTVAEAWLRPVGATVPTARLLGTAGRLPCVIAPMLAFPGVWHPLHSTGLMCVGSEEVRRAVLLGKTPVFIVRRDCVTGAEAYVEYRRGDEAATADVVFHALARAQGTAGEPKPAPALPAPVAACDAPLRTAEAALAREIDRVGWYAVNAAVRSRELTGEDYAMVAEESRDGSPEFVTLCGVRMDRLMACRVRRTAEAAKTTPRRLVGGILRGNAEHARLRDGLRTLRAWHASGRAAHVA